LVRRPSLIRMLEGNSFTLSTLPSLPVIFNSLKIAFNSVTARIASVDSSLLVNKPEPLKTFAILLTIGSSAAVPPVATIDLKPAELAMSFTPCSLIPLKLLYSFLCCFLPAKTKYTCTR